MKYNAIIFMVFNVLLAKSTEKTKDGEIEVKLQFFEYELEDFCTLKNEAQWKFLNGTDKNLKKLLSVEIKESEFYRKEIENLKKYEGKIESDRLKRLWEIFSHPGASLLGTSEFKEYRDYSIKIEEFTGKANIEYPIDSNSTVQQNEFDSPNKTNNEYGASTINYRAMNKLLFSNKHPGTLKQYWISWFQEIAKKNKQTKYDFVQQLSILDLEAEQNGEEELSDYWLKMSDVTWIDYDSAKALWNNILPLYNKLKNFIISLVVQNFGKNALYDSNLIPVHLLGSLSSHDWVTAVEKMEAFAHLLPYRRMKMFLSQRDTKSLYQMVDNQTVERGFGRLPQTFYESSRFDVTEETCRDKVMNYCEKENVLRIMSCSNENTSIKKFLSINENVMKMKYLLLAASPEEENGFLFREGTRDSVLYEAMEGVSSLLALSPKNFQMENNSTEQNQEKQNIFFLFIAALHAIPPLPYYLASDLWRINALQEIDSAVVENTMETTTLSPSFRTSDLLKNDNGSEVYDMSKAYDVNNLTRDWWNFRNQFQGISSPDGNLYEDYLQDTYIIWSKPYLSKFLGRILQFQILENLKAANFSSTKMDMASLMQKGKSKPWQNLLQVLNISEISAQPLLSYFKPLEEFLDKAMQFKNVTKIFGTDDFSFVPQSYSLNRKNMQNKDEKAHESSDTLFFSLAVITAVGVVAIIVTIGRRRYKKSQRARERKRRLAEL